MANILEDDELVRKLCLDILEKSGHQVVEASGGEEGVRLLGQGSVDLIITDIFLPKKDGVEIIREIRREFPNLKLSPSRVQEGGSTAFQRLKIWVRTEFL